MLTYLVYAAALLLEGLGSYISVIGLSSKSSIILIGLSIVLDYAKIVLASVLYKNWQTLNVLFKIFLVPVVIFLVMITSYGAYAYLVQEFGKTTTVQEQLTSKISSLETERSKLELRKLDIDKQIAEVPAQFVTQKKRLADMFAAEIDRVNARVVELDKEIPELKQNLMKDTNQAGTLGSLAKAWGTTPSQTAAVLAFMMVIVIDPLAIVMLMVGNFLQLQSKKEAETKTSHRVAFKNRSATAPSVTDRGELPEEVKKISETSENSAINNQVSQKVESKKQPTIIDAPKTSTEVAELIQPESVKKPKETSWSTTRPSTPIKKAEKVNSEEIESTDIKDILKTLEDHKPKFNDASSN